jgi:hypothetical protein
LTGGVGVVDERNGNGAAVVEGDVVDGPGDAVRPGAGWRKKHQQRGSGEHEAQNAQKHWEEDTRHNRWYLRYLLCIGREIKGIQ